MHRSSLLALALASPVAAQAQSTTADDAGQSTITVPIALATKRPAILFNRWQEDWSVLADPTLRTEPLDRLKYRALAPTDQRVWLTFGGGLRERFETNEAPLLGTVPGRADSYVISRAELFADLHAGPVQAFAEVQSDFAPGKRLRSPVDANRLDLEQAFVALVTPVGSGALKLRIGRQQFAFDLQRFVAVRDGPNIRQSFDAVWADYEIGKWRAIAYWSQPVANRDAKAFDDFSNGHNRFYGARLERKILGGSELSAYWSRFTDDGAAFLDAAGRERRDVLDLRFAGKSGAFDWDLEAMGQRGRVGDKRVRAWAMGSRSGYTFGGTLKPRLGLQVDAASGDRHPGDGTLGTFNPLFPNGAYLTLAGYTGYVNFIHVKPSVTVMPRTGLSVTAAAAAQWRMTVADAIYSQPGIALPRTAGQGSRWTGAYGQLRTDWAATAHVSLALEAVHFAIGDTLRAAGGHDGNYLGLEAKYGW
ncbi:MAG TPA: alginate export family protein [Sphingobium sp.]